MKWISIASLIAIVIGGGAALSSPPATMADSTDVRSHVPTLPKAVILSANLERSGKGYALSSKQLTSVRTLLARPPYYNPPDVACVILPLLDHKIILWAVGEKGLVPEDVVECNDKMQFLYSPKQGRFFEANDTPE